jgi:hypothetical protein
VAAPRRTQGKAREVHRTPQLRAVRMMLAQNTASMKRRERSRRVVADPVQAANLDKVQMFQGSIAVK